MATKSGTNATVKVAETVTVLNLANWSFTDEREALKAPVFGEGFNKVHGMGTRNISGSVSGYLDIDDATGQAILVAAYEGGTTVSGFRLCLDATPNYYHSSGTDDNDGVFITSYNVSAAQNEVIPVEFNFEVSGDWEQTA